MRRAKCGVGRERNCGLRIADCGTERSNTGKHYPPMKKELESRTKQFALGVIRAVEKFPRTKAADVLARQFLKSGTSIGANYREANRAQSHDDFIHKISLCEKEAAETEYWIELIIEADIMADESTSALLSEARELLAIFVASGRTAKSRR